MPRVLITGGLGFIFSHVTEHFVERGWEVAVIDNLSEGSHPEIVDEGGFSFYRYDVSDPVVIEKIIKLNPDYVIHAAANSDVDKSINDPLFVFKNNALSTLNVFEACRQLPNLKKLLYVSTDEVYGECSQRKREEDIIFPRNPYSLSKAVGSLMRLSYDNTYPSLKDKTAETRFCNVFGPRQDKRKIIPAIKRAIATGEPLPLHDGGVGYREWIYVKEIPKIVELILLSGNRTYNVTNSNGYTVHELIGLAERVTGKKVPTVSSHRPGMDVSYQMDGMRLREELGWSPQYSFLAAFTNYMKDKPL